MTWGDLRVGAIVENRGDILLVVSVDDSLVTLLLVCTGSNEADADVGKLEYWETGAVGWQRVLKCCKLLQEAS